MARCDTCGNDYDYSFVIVRGSEHFTFDSFECAIHKLAPVCGPVSYTHLRAHETTE